MYETMLQLYTTEYFRFLLTLALSFLTGLELREYKRSLEKAYFIGTVRTFTLIGMMGYIFYLLDGGGIYYLAGFAALVILFSLFYQRKLQEEQKGIITLLVGMVVYTYPAIIMTQPLWFTAMIFVSVIFVVNAKTQVHTLIQNVDSAELVTFAKLVLLSVVIWPLLPTDPISVWIPLSLSRMWMAIVIVSGISYVGYILQRYFFKEQGVMINGVIGGIYSSTATTVVLSRRSKSAESHQYTFISAIILATGMMYLRLLAIIGFLNIEFFKSLILPLGGLGFIALLSGYLIGRLNVEGSLETSEATTSNVNPLELGVALLFAGMFVVMTLITHFFINEYGSSGLNVLAVIIGFTDIDPFILSLINGKFAVSQNTIVSAILFAVGSNNIFKGFVALSLGSSRVGRLSMGILTVLACLTFGVALWV